MGQDVSTIMEEEEANRNTSNNDDNSNNSNSNAREETEGAARAGSRSTASSSSSASQRVTTRLTSLRRAARILHDESNRAGKSYSRISVFVSLISFVFLF